MRLHEALRQLKADLEKSGNTEPDAQARQMLLGILHMDAAAYLTHREDALTEDQEKRLCAALERRKTGEPLQYILGEWPFYGRMFSCDPRALIPREDTETLVTCVLEAFPQDRVLRGIDIGTGTGIIGLTLAAERPEWDMTCLDLSDDALSLARENAERLGLSGVHFLHGDMRECLREGPYDFIVSNPPYVRRGEIEGLEKELAFEPKLALDGGGDGLDFYRALRQRMEDSLCPGGLIAAEVGYDQGKDVSLLFAPTAEETWTVRDFAGIERVVAARKRG